MKLVVLTSGEAGGHGQQSPAEICRTREGETLAACKSIGIEDIEFWRQPDGGLQVSEGLIARLRATLESWMPHYVYAPHPAEMHVDHQAAAELLRAALRAPSPVCSGCVVRLYEVWTPIQHMDDIIDISEYVGLKLAAIQEHKTQINAMRLDEAAIALNRYRGEMHSWPGGDYAEVFQRLR